MQKEGWWRHTETACQPRSEVPLACGGSCLTLVAFWSDKKLAPNCSRPTSKKDWCRHTETACQWRPEGAFSLRRLLSNSAFWTDKRPAPNRSRPTFKKGWCRHTKTVFCCLSLQLPVCLVFFSLAAYFFLLLARFLLLALAPAFAPCFFFFLPDFLLLAPSCL